MVASVFADPAQTAGLFWRYMGAVALYTGVLIVLILAAASWLRRHPRWLQALNARTSSHFSHARGPASPLPGGGGWRTWMKFPKTRMPSSIEVNAATAMQGDGATAPLVLESALMLEAGRTAYVARVGRERFLLACSELGVTLLSPLEPAPQTGETAQIAKKIETPEQVVTVAADASLTGMALRLCQRLRAGRPANPPSAASRQQETP